MQGTSCLFGLKIYLAHNIQTVHRAEAAIALVLILQLAEGAVVNYFGANENFIQSLRAVRWTHVFLLRCEIRGSVLCLR